MRSSSASLPSERIRAAQEGAFEISEDGNSRSGRRCGDGAGDRERVCASRAELPLALRTGLSRHMGVLPVFAGWTPRLLLERIERDGGVAGQVSG